jgi:2-methylcitrate dehydratase PrpD
LIFGRAAEEEFDDHIVNREDVVALRRKVQATVDNNIREESADVTAILKDGRKIHVFVEHAIGSVQRPMTDAALEAKFHGMSDVVIGADKTNALLKACWGLGQATDVQALVALTQA